MAWTFPEDNWYDKGGWLVGDRWGDPGPHYEWYWNRATGRYETRERRNPVLTTTTGSTTLPDMARREVIEYTDEVDPEGSSSSIKHLYWNEYTERLTVIFVGRGTYSYDNVDAALWGDFVSAESLGKFFTSTFTPRGDDKWPGAKHDERLIEFVRVDTEDDETDAEEMAYDGLDVDALKPKGLTGGKGREFDLAFTFAGRSSMKVRATDAHAAIQMFMEHMARQGFTVTRVEATE